MLCSTKCLSKRYVILDISSLLKDLTMATRIQMAYLGTFSEFSSNQETWTTHVECLVQYLEANKIKDADQQQELMAREVFKCSCKLFSRI